MDIPSSLLIQASQSISDFLRGVAIHLMSGFLADEGSSCSKINMLAVKLVKWLIYLLPPPIFLLPDERAGSSAQMNSSLWVGEVGETNLCHHNLPYHQLVADPQACWRSYRPSS